MSSPPNWIGKTLTYPHGTTRKHILSQDFSKTVTITRFFQRLTIYLCKELDTSDNHGGSTNGVYANGGASGIMDGANLARQVRDVARYQGGDGKARMQAYAQLPCHGMHIASDGQ